MKDKYASFKFKELVVIALLSKLFCKKFAHNDAYKN